MTMMETLGYSVSVDEMIFQDERMLARLKDRMTDQVQDNAAESDLKYDPEMAVFFSGKPMRAYDEDGDYTGMHVIYTVEIPAWR